MKLLQSVAPIATEASSRPLIFQDVDGVLNHSAHGDGTLDPILLHNLGELVRNTNASLVISSAWRKYPEALHRLIYDGLEKVAGIPPNRVLGQTPSLCTGVDCRAEEIRSWLKAHPSLSNRAPWIAIDDRDIASHYRDFMRGHFVRTDAKFGLTSEKAQLAERLLAPKSTIGAETCERNIFPEMLLQRQGGKVRGNSFL